MTKKKAAVSRKRATTHRGTEEAMTAACALLCGDDGKRDLFLARTHLRAAVLRGDPRAMAGYGFMLARGDGGPRDDDSAVRWFHEAAKRNDSNGHFGLAISYAYGRAVEPDPIRAYAHGLIAGHNQAMPPRFGTALCNALSRRDRDLAMALAEQLKTTEQ